MSGYGFFARYYDALTRNVNYRAMAKRFDRLIRQNGGAPGLLLDLACGTGSLSVELAALGYDVIGVDASRDMLSVAMNKSVQADRSILYLCQPMEKLDLYGTVDTCVCALDSLNHLSDQTALAQAFSRVALFLNPGGLFLFDLNTEYKHRRVLADNAFVYDLPEVFCVWQNNRDEADDSVEITLDFFAPHTGKASYRRQTEAFVERVFPPDTVEELLDANGFSVLELLDGDTLETPGTACQRTLYVAKLKEREPIHYE